MSRPVRNSPVGGHRVNSERRGPLSWAQRELLADLIERPDLPTLDVALEVGCSSKTVQRYRKAARDEQE